MGQNAGHTVYSPEQVYAQLETIMVNIHKHAAEASEKYGLGYNLVAGANIAGFEKVAEAMMAQGPPACGPFLWGGYPQINHPSIIRLPEPSCVFPAHPFFVYTLINFPLSVRYR